MTVTSSFTYLFMERNVCLTCLLMQAMGAIMGLFRVNKPMTIQSNLCEARIHFVSV